MDPFRKYIITQIIKQTGKIPRADTVLSNAVAQLKIRLKNAGEDIAKITDPKQITQFFNKETSYWKQQVQQAIKAKDIGTKFSKQKGPFEGFTPKIVPKPKDIKSKLEGMNKKTIERIKRRRYEAAQKAEREKMAKDPNYLPKIIDPDDFLADGGVAGMLGEGPDKYSPKNFYALGIGPVLQDYLLGERPVDEEGFHTTLNEEDLKNLLNLLKEEGGFEDIKDELMFRFGRVNPEKKHSFHLGLGKDKAEIGFKKQFAGGGLAPLLGEPTYQDDNHRVPLKDGSWKPPSADENILEGIWKNMGPWQKVLWGLGLSPFEKGGRVELWQGGLAAALRFLMQKYGKDVIKLAKDVKPSKKWDTQKAIQGFLERNPQFKNKITSHAGDAPRAGEGKFTKAEVLLEMFKNTIKQSKSADTKKRFTNFSKEIQNKPELAKDPKVWNFFTKGLPKDQRLTVYADDTVDFWRQSKFGPHNIKTTDKFMKKHPYLTRDQAVKIQNMQPEDQIFELKKIQALNKRTMNAEGGIISLNAGGPLNTQALIQLYMAEGMTEEEATAAANKPLPFHILTDKAEGGRVGMLWGGGIFKTIIQNLARAKGVTPSDYLKITNWKALPNEVKKYISKVDFEKMKQGRIEMFENWVEMAKTRMNFLKNIEKGKKTPAAPIFEHLEKSFKSPVPGKVSQKDILQGEYILKNLKTKGRKLNASGGLARMLGE